MHVCTYVHTYYYHSIFSMNYVFRSFNTTPTHTPQLFCFHLSIFFKVEEIEYDIDGAPLSDEENEDEDVDGFPLDGAALLKGALLRGIPEAKSLSRGSPRGEMHMQDESRDMSDADDDIDGIPCNSGVLKFKIFIV